MAVADLHPDIADLEAFTLGTLNDAALADIEEHVANCPRCQEQAAQTAGDSLVELLRRAHERSVFAGDTVSPTAFPERTPAPVAVQGITQALGGSADGEDAGGPSIPADLAQHERYRVVRLLGEGGMGSVYKAEHLVMQRPVALKVINRAFTARPAVVERFRREVRAAARLSHPNIVTAFDAENAGDTHFLVMEFVEGVSLGQLVKECGPLPVAEACAYIRQAALGLQHAHERGMVHRDVKPDNLIRCTDGNVKVLDFGLAALTAERSGLTDTNLVMGTPDYMAPEQAENASAADIRADVYSLGCTLYYLLTGSVPYPAATPLLKILAHREQPLPSPRAARPDVPPELAAVVARLLAKKPEQRYQTPGEVVAALEPFTRTSKPDDKKRGRKIGWLVAAAVLFAGLIAVAGVVFYVKTDKGTIEIQTDDENVKLIAEGKQVTILDPKSKQTWIVDTGEWTVRLDGNPDGLKIEMPNTFTLKRGDKQVVTVKRVKGPGVAVKPPAEEKFTEVQRFEGFPVGSHALVIVLSPNARTLAAVVDGDIQLWDVSTGKKSHRLQGHNTQIYRLAFSPDEKSLVSGGAGSGDTVWLWDVESGKAKRHWLHEAWVTGVAFAPDGKTVFSCCHSNNDGTVRQWSVETGEEVKLFAGKEPYYRCLAISPDGRSIAGGTTQPLGIFVWDVKSGKEIRRFPGHETPGKIGETVLVFSPDGKRILSAGYDDTVRVWDIGSGKEVRRLEDCRLSGGGGVVEWAPDGRTLLEVRSDYRGLRRWDVETGKELPDFTDPAVFGVGARVILLRDSRFALGLFGDNTARLWRLPDLPTVKDKP